MTGIYGASCNSMYVLNTHILVFQKDIIYLCNQIEQSIYHRPSTPDYLMRNGSAKVYLMPSDCMVIDSTITYPADAENME